MNRGGGPEVTGIRYSYFITTEYRSSRGVEGSALRSPGNQRERLLI
jgi:hypothetical protein